ncbi:MAG TPA: aminotransferase class V-fold PLP-dependent enzyme [Gaiellaceae bacterium]|nr:aminotransferase class V-fold PLP-dependent enzyme [Gaiellaceae bacterium]
MTELTRRGLLARAGIATGAVALGRAAEVEAAPDLTDWRAVRAQFVLDPNRIHLTSFLLAAHPKPVRAAIERHRRRLDANPVDYLHASGSRLTAGARAAAGRFLGVAPSEVALTDSTTMGLGLLYTRLRLGAQDEVLTTEHDFYATHEALRLSGVRTRRVKLYDDPRRASVDEIVTALRRAVTPRTRVVALTWVHSSTGVKLPVRAIRDALPDRVLVCVDGVHGLGAEAETVRALRCDAFAAGCHKWLYGPRGTGVLWAGERVRELLRPTIPSFDDGESYGAWLAGGAPRGTPDGARLTPGGYHSFEHRWALAEAFAFHEAIGRPRVEARIRTLTSRLQAGLAGMRGVRLQTPAARSLSAGLVCFDVDGYDPTDVVARLAARRIVASVTPYARRHVRLGPGIVNSPADVDAAVRAIATL